MSVTIYHNPKCSKSRATLALLQERGVEPDIVLYLQHPPSASELRRLLDLLNLRPRELVRKNDPAYEASGMSAPDLDDTELIALMCKHPSVIERPIVTTGNRARIGRPPEKVLEIL